MPVTLAEAARNAPSAIDVSVIDQFRGNQLLDLLTFEDTVSPAGGGTLTYNYRRTLATAATVGFRALNTEYVPGEVSTRSASVDLKPLGGAFQVDRIIARMGPQASGAVALNMSQKVLAARNFFGAQFINGDSSVNALGFDGLSNILDGSDTEIDGSGADFNWAALDEAKSQSAIDALDAFLGTIDNVGAIIANKRVIAKVRSIARRAGYYDRSPGAVGAQIETYAGIRMIDAGELGGGRGDVIPVTGGTSDVYAVRFGLDAVHGVSMAGSPLVQTWLPDFSTPGAVKTGEVEMGPVAVAVQTTRSAAVLRGVRVSAAA